MVRHALIGFLLICTASLLVAAQEAPILIQPQQAGYSASQLSVLEEAIDRLAGDLNCTDLGSRKRLGEAGWTYEKAAAYTAGSLERLGYQVVIVAQRAEGIVVKAWVVVQIELGGAVAWIPVEPLPYEDIHQIDLGIVPLLSPLVYDASYLSYDSVVELPPNIAPTASFRVPPRGVVETEKTSWFGNASVDPDGEILLYHWTFGEDVQRVTNTLASWYTFEVGGMDYTVTLTVTDNRGAQATTSKTVYVDTL